MQGIPGVRPGIFCVRGLQQVTYREASLRARRGRAMQFALSQEIRHSYHATLPQCLAPEESREKVLPLRIAGFYECYLLPPRTRLDLFLTQNRLHRTSKDLVIDQVLAVVSCCEGTWMEFVPMLSRSTYNIICHAGIQSRSPLVCNDVDEVDAFAHFFPSQVPQWIGVERR